MSFTDPNQARQAGRASGVARRRLMLEHADHVAVVGELVDSMTREQIGPKFLEMALNVSRCATDTDITPTTPLELKQMVEAASVLHKMARLELGESTANTVTFSATDYAARKAALDARVAALAAEAGEGTQPRQE